MIPARLAAVRFPGKLLQPLDGVPIILRTLRRAQAAACFDSILCLTDSEEILALAREDGFDAALCGKAANGTERIARNLDRIPSDLVVNLQGDEPVFPVEALRLLRAAVRAAPEEVHLLVHPGEPSPDDMLNPERVKAVVDAEGRVLDFVRSPGVPAKRSLAASAQGAPGLRLQLGAYAYAKPWLRAYAALPPSARELELGHEMLRAPLQAPLRAHDCHRPSQPIDVPGDLGLARALLRPASVAASPAR